MVYHFWLIVLQIPCEQQGSESLAPGTGTATILNGGQSTVGMTVDWVTTVGDWGGEHCYSSHSGIIAESES